MAKISEYLKVSEAADYLGVSKDTLRRWDARGKLKAHRHPVSNFRLYAKSDLENFLRQVVSEDRRAAVSGESDSKPAKAGGRRRRRWGPPKPTQPDTADIR